MARATLNRRVLEDLARQHGLTVEEIVEEVRAFEALPLPAQLANIDEHQAELRADGIDVQRLKADLIRAAGVPSRPPTPAKRRGVSRPLT